MAEYSTAHASAHDSTVGISLAGRVRMREFSHGGLIGEVHGDSSPCRINLRFPAVSLLAAPSKRRHPQGVSLFVHRRHPPGVTGSPPLHASTTLLMPCSLPPWSSPSALRHHPPIVMQFRRCTPRACLHHPLDVVQSPPWFAPSAYRRPPNLA